MDKRKALIAAYKADYKENPPPMGVYRLTNTQNGKILIGTSLNLQGRANSYWAQLQFLSHHYPALREDLAIYGLEAFTFEILETIDPEKVPAADRRKAITALEAKWLDSLQPYGERGYHKPKPGPA